MHKYKGTGGEGSSSTAESFVGAQVIGCSIDFGMTGSSVSFYHDRVRNIPWTNGSKGCGKGSKIPTTICYDENGIIADWGFWPPQAKPRAFCLFKSLLDRNLWEKSMLAGDGRNSGLNSFEAVRKCVKDYLAVLLETALRQISIYIGSDNIIVNLVSTRPTTWTAETIEEYRSLTKKAFEEVIERCNSDISLWLNSVRLEAESYAVGTFVFESSKEIFGRDESVIYILDVGGATTDPAFLQAIPLSDSSGHPRLKSPVEPAATGIQRGCNDIDNQFSELVLGRLCRRWEQEYSASDVQKISSVLISTARDLRFEEKWIRRRNIYSKDAPFIPFSLQVPAVQLDDVNTLPEQIISIERSDMEDIFNASLLSAIQKIISDIPQTLNSSKLPPEKPCKVSHVALCGGGGFITRVFECVRNSIEANVTRISELQAASLGALHLVKHEVFHMHNTLQVGIKKGNEDPKVVRLTGVEVQTSKSRPTLAFSHSWNQRQGVNLLRQFVLTFNAYIPGDARHETWTLHSPAKAENQTGFQYLKSIRYQILLTLPTTTTEVTPMDFSAFVVEKNGKETRIEFIAKKEE